MRTSSCTRAFQSLRSPIRSSTHVQIISQRTFASSSSLRDDDAGGEDGTFKKGKRSKVDPQLVEDWFRGEGLPYLNPTPGKSNWLGGDVPFPDNPTFRPPPPLSDVVKSAVYDRYLKTLETGRSKAQAHEQTVRALSEKFGISIARVEAIIRLKQHEQEYQKGKKIQHAFQRGMESYLGIRQDRDRVTVSDSKFRAGDINAARQRASEVDKEVADSIGQRQKAGAARRIWWEMADDVPNAQPIVPGLVTKGLEEYHSKIAEEQQAHAGVSLTVDGPTPPQSKPRSVFTFVDTGAKDPKQVKKARA
ncbi:hypothetical protein BDV93DRAFT_609141 [Ceratobasidium sp. AG-I]|nr:hypothetical protein BDV93DRAFT_609141 [Ceratobasidium sp. AG-I]